MNLGYFSVCFTEKNASIQVGKIIWERPFDMIESEGGEQESMAV